jgi:hypothetical protein
MTCTSDLSRRFGCGIFCLVVAFVFAGPPRLCLVAFPPLGFGGSDLLLSSHRSPHLRSSLLEKLLQCRFQMDSASLTATSIAGRH